MQVVAPLDRLGLEMRISPEFFHLPGGQNGDRFTAAFVFTGDLWVVIEDATTAESGDALLLEIIGEALQNFVKLLV